MIVAGIYSFKNGKEALEANFPAALGEIFQIISSVDAAACKTKISEERTMMGRALYSPRELNRVYAEMFGQHGWRTERIPCDYSSAYYVGGYASSVSSQGAFREMDFVKDRVGVEIQFGKYAFMVYNVCAKMTIFRNCGIIAAGVEIVPVKDLANEMSTGVSYFEQIVWDLEHRGEADIDIPVLVLGVAAE